MRGIVDFFIVIGAVGSALLPLITALAMHWFGG
jgi:hypothetical protein